MNTYFEHYVLKIIKLKLELFLYIFSLNCRIKERVFSRDYFFTESSLVSGKIKTLY